MDWYEFNRAMGRACSAVALTLVALSVLAVIATLSVLLWRIHPGFSVGFVSIFLGPFAWAAYEGLKSGR